MPSKHFFFLVRVGGVTAHPAGQLRAAGGAVFEKKRTARPRAPVSVKRGGGRLRKMSKCRKKRMQYEVHP